MNDWTALAQARGLKIGDRELDRIAGLLRSLEQVFRPLVRELPHGLDPATAFRANPEDVE